MSAEAIAASPPPPLVADPTARPVELPVLPAYLCPKLLEYRFLGGIATAPAPSNSLPTPRLCRLALLSLSELAPLPLVPGRRSPRLEGANPGGDNFALKPVPIGEGGNLGVGEAEGCLECVGPTVAIGAAIGEPPTIPVGPPPCRMERDGEELVPLDNVFDLNG